MKIRNLSINEYYFHSVLSSAIGSLHTIESIFESGYIKTPASQGNNFRGGCHKESEICLSKVTDMNIQGDYESCFDLFVNTLTSFIIDGNLDNIYKPILVSTDTMYECYQDGDKTNLYDEYRTQNNIPVRTIQGISIPYQRLINDPFYFSLFMNQELLAKHYNEGIPAPMINMFRLQMSGLNARKERLHMINDVYIKRLEELIKKNNLDISIYHYDEREKRLELRK